MLWAACCLGFFGFLKAGEFTVNSPFDPASHLSPEDFQVDSRSNPTCMRVQIKCSKTDPFRQGCCIYLGRGRSSICPISAITAYLTLHGDSPWWLPGPLLPSHGWLSLDSPDIVLVSASYAVGIRVLEDIFGSQFPHWGGNLSSSTGHPRSFDQDHGLLVQRCLPVVYQNSHEDCS